MKDIISKWGITRSDIVKITDRVWKLNDEFILKKYDDKYGIETNIGIISTLQEIDIKVPTIFLTKENLSYIEYNNAYYMMMESLGGAHISNESVIQDEALSYEIGQIIAKLQLGLKKVEDKYDFYDNNFLEELNGWIKDTLDNSTEQFYARDAFNELIDEMSEIYPRLIRQPIHRDFHLNNILYKENKFSGFIDFDISQKNARIYDLAYFCVGALAENFENDLLRSKWSMYLTTIIKGYNSIEKLSSHEEENLYLLMASIEMLFVAFFTSIDNLELAKSADRVFEWLWLNRTKKQLVIP